MDHHLKLTDAQFLGHFNDCTLPPALFSHEAHLRLAWLNIKQLGAALAITKVQSQIKAYVKAVGATDKYNTTLTIAAVQMVNHFMQRSNAKHFTDFMKEYPQLKADFKRLIKAHYSFDIFNSAQAKTTYLAPDLQPF